jgi:ankyrin repeat protein
MTELGWFAACELGDLQAVATILPQLQNKNAQDALGRTGIFLAASKNRHELLHHLLQGGCDGNIPNAKGSTPLIIAAFNGFIKCLSILTESGADANKANCDLCAPLLLAAKAGHDECCEWLVSKCNVDVNAQNRFGDTALGLASFGGFGSIVSLLISNGASVNLANHLGTSPLLYAVSEDQQECVQILVDCGANPRAVDANGTSVLISAASVGRLECLQFLVTLDLEHRDNNGESALDWAKKNGHEDCMSYIETHLYGASRASTPDLSRALDRIAELELENARLACELAEARQGKQQHVPDKSVSPHSVAPVHVSDTEAHDAGKAIVRALPVAASAAVEAAVEQEEEEEEDGEECEEEGEAGEEESGVG